MLAIGQLKKIAFDANGFQLKITKDNASYTIANLLGLPSDFSFKLVESKNITSVNREVHYTYQQYFKEYPIEFAVLKLHYRDNQLHYINGEFLADFPKNTKPTFSEMEAFENAKKNVNAEKYVWDYPAELDVLPKNESTELIFPTPHASITYYTMGNSSYLTYKFDIYALAPLSRNYVYIDANTGKVITKNSRIHFVNGTAATRYSGTRTISTQQNENMWRLRDYDSNRGNGIETYNMQHAIRDPASYSNAIDFSDNDNNWTSTEFDNNNKDNAALDAHWGAEMTYDYWKNVHGRNSFDGNGGIIKSYVHLQTNYENAFWNGSVMSYGDGATSLDALTSIDVVAHEIGHGLCQYTAGLLYQNESGAINEGLSDIWAACIEDYATINKQTWLCGEDIDLRGNGHALRSMSNPNAEGQPDTYNGSNWYSQVNCTQDPYNDFCGVHTNSGVLNYWFYLLSQGGSGTNDISNTFNVSSIGIDNASKIVFRAETVYMTANTNYSDARNFTIKAAQDIFGYCSQEVISTINAWYAVGVGNSYNSLSNITISNTISNGTVQDFYASHFITASNTIETNTRVKYEASAAIIMNPSFNTALGTNFLAQIVVCKDLSANKTDNALKNGAEDNLDQNLSQKFESKNNSNCQIFPNPTNGFINIVFPYVTFKESDIFISDLSGRTIKKITTNSKINQIDLTEYPTGVYIIKIQIADTIYNAKIIKQ